MKQFTHNEAIIFLNDQYWHDSVLYEIRIIRTDSVDQAVIILDLITSEDGMESNRCPLTFNDCYYIGAYMNGGVDAISDGEMIYQAAAGADSPLIEQVIESWKTVMKIADLFYFSMILSSTDIKIDIVCKSVTIKND